MGGVQAPTAHQILVPAQKNAYVNHHKPDPSGGRRAGQGSLRSISPHKGITNLITLLISFALFCDGGGGGMKESECIPVSSGTNVVLFPSDSPPGGEALQSHSQMFCPPQRCATTSSPRLRALPTRRSRAPGRPAAAPNRRKVQPLLGATPEMPSSAPSCPFFLIWGNVLVILFSANPLKPPRVSEGV